MLTDQIINCDYTLKLRENAAQIYLQLLSSLVEGEYIASRIRN